MCTGYNILYKKPFKKSSRLINCHHQKELWCEERRKITDILFKFFLSKTFLSHVLTKSYNWFCKADSFNYRIIKTNILFLFSVIPLNLSFIFLSFLEKSITLFCTFLSTLFLRLTAFYIFYLANFNKLVWHVCLTFV